jgi:hypothetical protein
MLPDALRRRLLAARSMRGAACAQIFGVSVSPAPPYQNATGVCGCPAPPYTPAPPPLAVPDGISAAAWAIVLKFVDPTCKCARVNNRPSSTHTSTAGEPRRGVRARMGVSTSQ